MRFKGFVAGVAAVASVAILALGPPASAGKVPGRLTLGVDTRSSCLLATTFTWSSEPLGAVYVETDVFKDGSTSIFASTGAVALSDPAVSGDTQTKVFYAADASHSYQARSYFMNASYGATGPYMFYTRNMKFTCR